MAKQNIQTLKGFRDFLPEEALKRQWLKERLQEIFELWGYAPMETPTLEPLELFEGQIGEDEKLFFKFEDQGGRQVALRYDQTVPTCRVVGQYAQQLPMPFKRYQIQLAYRSEKPQKGRYREFLQCDADIFGVDSPYADAEVIALSLDIYRKLGFKNAKVLINDRALLKDLPYDAIVAIDKLQKIGEQGVIADMMKKGIEEANARAYLETIKNIKPNDTIKIIFEVLKSYGFPESWYSFEPTIARSFSYSTGPIWEVVIPDASGGSVLGGERFDKLVENISGQKIPATGFGLGFDRTLEALEELKLMPEIKIKTKILITIFDKNLVEKSVEVAKYLRDLKIDIEVYTNPEDKLGKQLKYADKKGIPFVLIIGEEEIKQNKVTLKNMQSGESQLVSLAEVISKI